MASSLLRAGVAVPQAQIGGHNKTSNSTSRKAVCKGSLSQQTASLNSNKSQSLFRWRPSVQPLKQPLTWRASARAKTISVLVTSQVAETPTQQEPLDPADYPDCEVNPNRRLDINLPDLAEGLGTKEQPLDLIIVGCGPAGLGAADKASARGLKVALVDPNPRAYWMNNYGVWVDEFEQLGLADCFTKTWSSARVVVGDEESEETEDNDIILNRPYAQVDRIKLKTKLLQRCVDQGVGFVASAVDTVDHGPTNNATGAVQLLGGKELFARSVLDATGHSRRLVEFDNTFTPGYQAAYGILAKVESHPFPLDQMLFMDWRDSHLDEKLKAQNDTLPTFLYAMPFAKDYIFLEETSLVARPPISFDELKERLTQRLDNLGINVLCIDEEEYCLIPMGGVLPTFPQRTLGIGGTAGMVHPSTGFMVSKTLSSAEVLVDAVADALEDGKKGTAFSKEVWEKVWSKQDLRLRTFMCFGMETLMKLNIENTRFFFKAFFGLPYQLWSGFLSWRITMLTLIEMGLTLFFNLEPKPRIRFMLTTLPFLGSFTANFLRNTNDFDSRPWGGMDEKLLKKGAGKSSDERDDDDNGPSGGGGAPAAKMKQIPVPVKKYESKDASEVKAQLEAQLQFSLDKPLPASALRDDRDWTRFQQTKKMQDQAPAAEVLAPLVPGEQLDAMVVGMGPSGLALAAELGEKGLKVGLISPDVPFVNTYGVWHDEFEALGLAHTLETVYEDVTVWMDEKCPVGGTDLGRAYGKVGRKQLRDHLLGRCQAAGVRFHDDLVEEIDNLEGHSEVTCRGGLKVEAKVVTLATGHNREMLKYENDETPFGWQTAYGVEVKIPDHPFPLDRAVFMDFRQSDAEATKSGVWRVPSFLYVLPVDKDTVFLEETCLASSVQMPFDELKRRLYMRMSLMGISIDLEKDIIEEEASWIPLGGPLPVSQRNIAFGAAACMVHPASGYSIVNSLRQAKQLASTIATGLQTGDVSKTSHDAWAMIWSPEKKRRMAFYQFGMMLIASLRISELRAFFVTFYGLPRGLHQRFLSMDLSSVELLLFAMSFFVLGTNRLRQLLVMHLASPAGKRFLEIYQQTLQAQFGGDTEAEAAAVGPAAKLPPKGQVKRTSPPQSPASTISAISMELAENSGLNSGFAVVSSRD
uniref:lycopene beta-cyclase n=1 Tax=Pyramimonas obovata TaxID=1411642 RepID=A0A7S0N756_9CHLO|mmetsp:Transcript_22224/g.48805  ORF Transcript_22224/g.48805 Transcript_22224/m.48805 type:complete len:1147 (+) Transcript_22224:154-3594(+)|eukprot:CAMPEP_0118927916 /NCGR_PEP_ID=MMETSP1169-20130426/5292_1 /TAXON_ID=36882 /ORGANISM="Pyramimonas obovata, Strain CCMP722" /LENGTH=1146 /DNA_ID=CAMNT_0006869787 /DNA_START=128 /DNA_END=3568 /DNA_ORIENTATION=-